MAKSPENKITEMPGDEPANATLPTVAPDAVAPDAVAPETGVDGSQRVPASVVQRRRAASRPTSRAMLRNLLQQRTVERQAALQHVARLQETLEQRRRQIEAMHRVSETMFQQPGMDVMSRQTLTIALDVLGAEAGSLQLYDPDQDALVFQHVIGPTADILTGFVMPASQGISGQVLRTGVPDVTRHVGQLGGFNPMLGRNRNDGQRAEAMATVPLKRPAGDAIGVMQLLKASEEGFDRGDLEVLQVLCGQAATAIETARLVQQARKAEVAGIIGDVAHDIKNMLTPIQTGLMTLQPLMDDFFTELDAVRRKYEGHAVQRDIERILPLLRDDYGWIFDGALEACGQVEARTRDIADAVKGEVAPPFFETADLNEIVGEVARPMFMLADKTNVHLHLDLDHEMPRAEFDRKQLYNALYNLVNNAIPETPSGGSVTIRTRGPAPNADDAFEKNTLLLEVEDTGSGMPEHVRARLFTDQAISTKQGGTGLGTRIVANVVRRHHGRITVQSEQGKGSTFSIRLPLRHNPDAAGEVATSQRLPQRRHNLPSPSTALIGRETERETVCDLLRGAATRLLTLTGAGGMGKTRLALQVAHDLIEDFEGGVWFISLAPVDNPAMVASALAATLGVREEPGRPLAETLTEYLRSRRLLLVLDNFERIVEAAPMIAGLLDECPELHLLVTSRSVLRLRGEREMPVSPLELPDPGQMAQARRPTSADVAAWAQYPAIALFVERAAKAQPGFALGLENARDVAEICARLDGLPLAIELAAAHGGVLTPHDMRARLANRLELLEAEVSEREPELPARHQTLRAAIDWSYQLLSQSQRRLFRRLMVFEGGCTPEAAQAVCGADGDFDVADSLSQLADTSLVRCTRQQESGPWFWVLETIREYGLEKLGGVGECPCMQRRHAEYYLTVAESAQQHRLKSPQAAPPLPGVPPSDASPGLWSDWRKREDSNLRAAMTWFLDSAATQSANESSANESSEEGRSSHGALRMALTLRDLWTGDRWNERREALQRALQQSEDAPVVMRLMGMLRLGDLASLQGDYQNAEEFGRQSLELSRQNGVIWAVGRALGILANAALEQDDFSTARALHEESLEIKRADTDAEGIAWTLCHLGIVEQRSHDTQSAHACFERSLDIFREIENREGAAWTLYHLGTVVYHRDDPAPAHRLLEDALATFRELENKSGLASSLSFLGKMAGHERNFALARARLEESLELARQLGHRGTISSTLWNLGDVALAEGDHATARAWYREVMTTLQTMSNSARLRLLLRSFARLAAAEGRMESAARLLGAFDALAGKQSSGVSAAPETWQRREAILARGVLGEIAFATAWEQGRAMPLQQALDEALQS